MRHAPPGASCAAMAAAAGGAGLILMLETPLALDAARCGGAGIARPDLFAAVAALVAINAVT